MSKEYLEAFKNLKQELYYSPNQIPDIDKWHEIIEQALQRLEAIDNAESNEALEKLDSMYRLCTPQHHYGPLDNCYNTIKNYILNAQDKVKAFDLINEKDVDVKLLKWAYPSVEAYNVKVRTEKDYWWRKELTKEEFEFIGRLVGAE